MQAPKRVRCTPYHASVESSSLLVRAAILIEDYTELYSKLTRVLFEMQPRMGAQPARKRVSRLGLLGPAASDVMGATQTRSDINQLSPAPRMTTVTEHLAVGGRAVAVWWWVDTEWPVNESGQISGTARHRMRWRRLSGRVYGV